jgi:hypothetical protein
MSVPEITILSLPDELLRYIAAIYVNDELETHKWPRLHYTCKRLKELADPVNIPCIIYVPYLNSHGAHKQIDDSCRKIPDRYKPKINFIDSYAKDLSIYNGFRHISIHRKDTPIEKQPEIIWSECNISEISFNCYLHPIKFEYITNIRALSLYRTAGDYHYDLRILPHLKELNVSEVHRSTFAIPNTLKIVKLANCRGLNGDEFIDIDWLTIAWCKDTDYNKFDNNIGLHIEYIIYHYDWPYFKRIEDLRLSCINNITFIPYLKNLKRITVWNSYISDISSIAHLEYIDIRGSQQLYTLPYMPNVEELCIIGCPAIHKYSREELHKLCPKLKRIIA